MIISLEWTPVALALMLFPLAMALAADTSASGWIEVKGQRVALKHVFAAMAEDAMEGDGKERIEVLLSDKPVPPELQKATDAWSFWAGDQAQKGEMHGIIVYLNPETGVWSRGQRLSANGLEFYSHSASSPEASDLVFTPARAADGEIAGKISMKEAMRGVDEDQGPWRVEAEFRVPVVMRPAITATYTGAEALKSPQYKTVQEHLQACKRQDLDAIRKNLNSNAQKLMAKYEAMQGKEVVLAMFAEEASDIAQAKLTKIIVRGDTAEVMFAGGSDSTVQQTLRVALENGVWKYGQ
jgi:hypothetical protein